MAYMATEPPNLPLTETSAKGPLNVGPCKPNLLEPHNPSVENGVWRCFTWSLLARYATWLRRYTTLQQHKTLVRHTTPHQATLNCTTPRHTTLHHTSLHHTIPRHTTANHSPAQPSTAQPCSRPAVSAPFRPICRRPPLIPVKSPTFICLDRTPGQRCHHTVTRKLGNYLLDTKSLKFLNITSW